MLMAIGMKFHQFANPRPPSPSFKVVVPSRLASKPGTFKLVFYVPDSYFTAPEDYRFPVVINYHGGGFTLGSGTDDARWASAVVLQAEAVCVSVEYRLAPEHPFSTGVEDSCDALIYIAAHAEELRLDPHRIALSGFSAGGNFALTVPLMLHDLIHHEGRRTLTREETPLDLATPSSAHSDYNFNFSVSSPDPDSGGRSNSDPDPNSNRSNPELRTIASKLRPSSLSASASASNLHLAPPRLNLPRNHSSSSLLKLTDFEPTTLEMEHKVPDLTIKALVSFYPPTDFRISRDEKRATNPQPDLNLSKRLANLFDQSYLNPKDAIDSADPYLSPMAASDSLLSAAYPSDIILYTCEFDMLNAEASAFGSRLASPPLNKSVHGGLVRGVPHGFDRTPNPLRFSKEAERCYAEACAELMRVFGKETSIEERRQLEQSRPVERFTDADDGIAFVPEADESERSRGNNLV